jgi:hypothetical protein
MTSSSPATAWLTGIKPSAALAHPTSPWNVISTDPADLWRELAACARFGANTGARAAGAP